MGFLLLAVLLLLPCVLVASAYAAVTRTRTITNASVAVLRRLLRHVEVIPQGDGGGVVEPCTGGIVLKDVLLPDKLLCLTSGSVTVPSVSVRQVQLLWATSSSPLTLRVSGVAVKVLQRRTAPKAKPDAAESRHNSGKLRALEALIWHGVQQVSSSGWRSRQLRLLRFFIALALRNVSLSVTDVHLQYMQTGDPAPELSATEGCAVDAVAVTIRAAEVSPVVNRHAQAARDVGSDISASQPSRQGSADSTQSAEVADLPPSIQSRLYEWRHLSAVAPRVKALRDWLYGMAHGRQQVQYRNASRVTVSGVNVVLMSKGPDATKAAPVAGPQRPAMRSGPAQVFELRKRRGRVGGAMTFIARPVSTGRGHAPAAEGSQSCQEPQWDSKHVVLQQWNIQIDVSLDMHTPMAASPAGRTGRSGQQPAFRIEGAFGAKSRRGQHFHGREPAASSSCPDGAAAENHVSGSAGLPSSAGAAACPDVEHQRQQPRPANRQQGDYQRGPSTASRPAEQNSSSSKSASLSVHVSINLKALVPELTPETTVQILRMVDRITTFEKYQKYWRRRPSVRVTQSPVAWWQHAGRAIIDDCREHYPLRKLSDFMARRAEYIRVYKALRSTRPGFMHKIRMPLYDVGYQATVSEQPATAVDGAGTGNLASSPGVAAAVADTPAPGRARNVPYVLLSYGLGDVTYRRSKDDARTSTDLHHQLTRLESHLTLGQIMCYRTFVSLWHSKYLAGSPVLKERWKAAMGVITSFVDAIPTMEEEDTEESIDDSLTDKRTAAPSGISLTVSCPRLGLKFLNKRLDFDPAAGSTLGAGTGTQAGAAKPKREVDVLAVVLEGICFSMPSVHHVTLQAATVKLVHLSEHTSSCKHMLLLPAPRESLELHGTKLDFSQSSISGASAVLPGARPGRKSTASCAAIYGDAPISSYLSRFQVTLAPVEVALIHPPFVLACARYLKRMVDLKASACPTTSGADVSWPSTSLHALVLDSYMRNRVPLPSSMAAFVPELDLRCPMVSVRWILAPQFAPTVGDVSGRSSDAMIVAVLTELHLSSQYVHTCYSALLHATSARAHAEVYFQFLPRPDQTLTQHVSQAASPVEGVPSGQEPSVLRPQYGPFAKVWLHPDDVPIAFPPGAELELRRAVGVSMKGNRRNSRTSHDSGAHCPPGNMRLTTSGASEIPLIPGVRGPSAYPFVPLIKVRSLSALATSQVPYEPAVPGTMTTHQTVAVHSIMAWFSPWQAKFLVAMVDQFLAHPVLVFMRNVREEKAGRGAAASPSASAGTSEADPDTSSAKPEGDSRAMAATVGHPSGGSSISILLDVPLLTVNCFVELPEALRNPDERHTRMDAMQSSGSELQVPAWVGSSRRGLQMNEWTALAESDPVVRWGLSITPLLTANVTNLRAGLRLTSKNNVYVALQTTGLQVSDHQARLKRQLYHGIWLPNAGCPSKGLGAAAPRQGLLPEEASDQLLGPLEARARALRTFARDRRRAALCLSLLLARNHEERQGQARQQWRRLLELQQLQRASDYAMFLLSTTHKTALRLPVQLEPLDLYKALFKDFREAQEAEKRAKGQGNSTGNSSEGGTSQPLTDSVFGSSTHVLSGLPSKRNAALGSQLYNRLSSFAQRNAEHGRSISSLAGAPGAGAFRPVPTQHRKAASLVQVLTSVNNPQGLLALQRSIMAADVALGAGRTQLLSSRDVLGTNRLSMGCIPEGGRMLSTFGRVSEGSALANQMSGSAASATGLAPGDAGGNFRRCSSPPYRRTSSSLGGADIEELLPSAGNAPGEGSSMPSAFTTAGARVAVPAPQRTAGPRRGPEGDAGGRQGCTASDASPRMLEAQAKLGFVRAFRHLKIRASFSRQPVCVYSVPFPTSTIEIMLVQAPSRGHAAPSKELQASCDNMIGCLGVHSIGALLKMLVQTHQAAMWRQARDSTPREPVGTSGDTHQPSTAPCRLNVLFGYIGFKVVLEEKPRRVSPRAGPPPPGLTELSSVRLQGLEFEMLRSDVSPHEPAVGMSVHVRVKNVQVLDLQGCVEHRNVLVGNRHVPPSSSGSDSARQSAYQEHECPYYQLDVSCKLPPRSDVPTEILVSIRDVCVTWLRRFSNNLLYAVGRIKKAYMDAAWKEAATPSAEPTAESPGNPRTTAHGPDVKAPDLGHRSTTSRQLPPVIVLMVTNFTGIMPAGAEATKAPIRRAIFNESLVLFARQLAICVPGDTSALEGLEYVESSMFQHADDDALEWMVSAEHIDNLILSSLRLGEKHFPQLSQQPIMETRASEPRQASRGNTGAASGPQVVADVVSPQRTAGRLQRHLQAAKVHILDPIKGVLQDAGQKQNQLRGELGLVLINEIPTVAPVGELSAGYLTIPEDGGGTVAAVQHTTTTVCMSPTHAGPTGRQLSIGSGGLAEKGSTQRQPCPAGPIELAESVGCATVKSLDRGGEGAKPRPACVSREHPPVVLFSASGLEAYTGVLVPCDSQRYRNGRPAVSAAVSSRKRQPGTIDREVEEALDLLADPDLQLLQRLIDPVNLKGVFFHHRPHGALQLHLCAPDGMAAALGPMRYQRMLKVLTDNVVEGFSCFDVGMTAPASREPRNTSFSANTSFGPRPGQRPFFHLTVDWPEQLSAALECDPTWWDERKALDQGKAPGPMVEPCLQACFTRCSFGLMMMQHTNDMHIAFISQQLHVADVRVSAMVSEAAKGKSQAGGDDRSSDVFRFTSAGPSARQMDSSVVDEGGSFDDDAYEDETTFDGEYGEVQDAFTDDASTGATDVPELQPVIDDQQTGAFPDKPAIITLVRSNISLPAEESAHLAKASAADMSSRGCSGLCPPDDQHGCVRVAFSMLADRTMVNEIELCHTLVQWPYLTEMSLVSSVIAIFLPRWGHPPCGPEAALRLDVAPWFYFNILLSDSQLYVPALSPHLRRMEYGWRATAAEFAGTELHVTAEKLQELFASMVAVSSSGHYATADTRLGGDMPSAQRRKDSVIQQPAAVPRSKASSVTIDVAGGLPGLASTTKRFLAGHGASEDDTARLEHTGVALTMSALRVAYFGGGDGEAIVKVDLRNIAGFVRHSAAQVTNWLLPVRSMTFEYRISMPMVEESKLLQSYILVARALVLRIRLLDRLKRSAEAQEKAGRSQQPPELSAQQRPLETSSNVSLANNVPMRLPPSDGGGLSAAGVAPGGDDLMSVRSRNPRSSDTMKAPLDLLVEQATARVVGLLQDHKLPLPTGAQTRVGVEKVLSRKGAVSTLTFNLDTAVVRASFSNIPLLHAALDDLGLISDLIQRNKGLFARAPGIAAAAPVTAERQAGQSEEAAEARASWNFRPSTMFLELQVQSMALVLCDDKPRSYGAPDVLAAALERVQVQYSADKRYCDHLPEQLGCVSFRLSAQFLNNSTGRWEHLLEPWPAELHLSDPINPVFKTSRTKYIYMSSAELLKLSFHPSCLLTIGDALAFVRRLSDRHAELLAAGSRARTDTVAPDAEKPPSVSEQLALGGSLMSRVPQRYLIQNMTGMLLSYWAPQPDQDNRLQTGTSKKYLPSGCSQELQVTPTVKQVKIVGPGGVVVTRLHAQVIVLKFEGNWMPIPDVSVDVVGKYCYELHSPRDNCRVPVIVDVVLVGRTKILKIHSALFIKNNTVLRMGFRLHFPSPMLARQTALSSGDMQLPGEQDIRLRSLKSNEGRYLPVLAALGGTLYLEPRTGGKNGCVYMPSEHDVIRLSPDVNDMSRQSGYIACGPPVQGHKGLYGNSPLQFAVKVEVKSTIEYSYASFHAMEVPGPGLFAKASRPLEASIKIAPTVILQNALPYYMEGYLITLSARELRPLGTNPTAAQAVPSPHGVNQGNVPKATGSEPNGKPSLHTMESKKLMRPRRDPHPPEISEEELNSIVSDFLALVQLLKHRNCIPETREWARMKPMEKKLHLLAMLRYELRFATREGAKEMDLLRRCENREQAEKVTWQELATFLEWANANMRRAQIYPGQEQQHFVDMHKQVILCLRVPELKLISSGPVEVNCGGLGISRETQQLPEVMSLRNTSGAETLDAIRGVFFKTKNTDLHSRNVHDALEGFTNVVRDTGRAVVAASNTGQQAVAVLGSTISGMLKQQGTREADLQASWELNRDKLVRVQFQVVPGPWPGPGACHDANRVSQEIAPASASTVLFDVLDRSTRPHPNTSTAGMTLGSTSTQMSPMPTIETALEGPDAGFAVADQHSVQLLTTASSASPATAAAGGRPKGAPEAGLAPAVMPAAVADVELTNVLSSGSTAGEDAATGLQSGPVTAAQGANFIVHSSPVSSSHATSPNAQALSPRPGRFSWFKQPGNKAKVAGQPAVAILEKTVRFTDETSSMLSNIPSPSSDYARAPKTPTGSGLTPVQQDLTSAQVTTQNVSSAPGEMEQHIRVQLSYRPPPAAPKVLAQVKKRIQTVLHQIIPATNPSKGNGPWYSATMKKVPSSASPATPGCRHSSPASFQRVRVQLKVVQADLGAPAYVQVRLSVVYESDKGSVDSGSERRRVMRRYQTDEGPHQRLQRRRGSSPLDIEGTSASEHDVGVDILGSKQDRADKGGGGVSTTLDGVLSAGTPQGQPWQVSPLGLGNASVLQDTPLEWQPPFIGNLGTAVLAPAPAGLSGVSAAPIDSSDVVGSLAQHNFPSATMQQFGAAMTPLPPQPFTPCRTSVSEVTGVARTGELSEASPGTVVITRSGENSPISVPSLSPQHGSLPRPEGAKGAYAAGLTPGQLGVDVLLTADGLPPPRPTASASSPAAAAQSASPSPGGDGLNHLTYTVWSENVAYRYGSGISSSSASELPVQRSVNAFRPHNEPQVEVEEMQRKVPGAVKASVIKRSGLPRGRSAILSGGYSLRIFPGKAFRSASNVLSRSGQSSGGSNTSGAGVGRFWRQQRAHLRPASVGASSSPRRSSGEGPGDDNAEAEPPNRYRARGSRFQQRGVVHQGSFSSKSDGDAPANFEAGILSDAYDVPANTHTRAVGSPGHAVKASWSAALLHAVRDPNPRHRQPGMKTADEVQRTCSALDGLDALLSPPSDMQFHSNEVHGEISRREQATVSRPRLAKLGPRRFLTRPTAQPSFKQLKSASLTESTRLAMARSAASAVQRLPSVARNMGEKFKDGGHQVAHTLRASGQGVKAGTGHVYNAAKPKIKKSLGDLAEQMTECMRRRKQGDAQFKDKKLLLSLHNSLAAKEEDFLCRLTLSAPFWVDNRTGFDLVFKEQDVYPYADNLPFLTWTPVFAPGHKGDASALDNPDAAIGAPRTSVAAVQGSISSLPPAQHPPSGLAAALQRALPKVQLYKPVLLNDQGRARFRVEDNHYSKTDFSDAFTVENTNQKFAMDIKAEKCVITFQEFNNLMTQASSRATRAPGEASLGVVPPRRPMKAVPEDVQVPGLSVGTSNVELTVASFNSALPSAAAPRPAPGRVMTEPMEGGVIFGTQPQQQTAELDAVASATVPAAEPSPEIVPADDGDEGVLASKGPGQIRLSAVEPLTPAPTFMLAGDVGNSGRLTSLPSVVTVVEDPEHTKHTGKCAAHASSDVAAAKRSSWLKEQPKTVVIRRMYQFAVEVWPAPTDTVFNRTKVITVKNKYLILNSTGLTIEYKQKGTPDPVEGLRFGEGRRFSGRLRNGWRAAWHWDNMYADQELMIRPVGGDWEWSGSFKLPEIEDYFGLRIRHRQHRTYVIIPVNITVGAAGSVLVTLKSKESVPPYMVINRCRDVTIRLKQADWVGRTGADASPGDWSDWDEIQPSQLDGKPFAWDEPRLRHVVQVVAVIQREERYRGRDREFNFCKNKAVDINLDAVDANTIIYVQTRSAQSQMLALGVESRSRLKDLDYTAKKVYVTVYADGPTRVLCFSEDRTGMASMDDENSLLNLSYRLQQVTVRLKDVEHRLAQQFGGVQDHLPLSKDAAGRMDSNAQATALGAVPASAASTNDYQAPRHASSLGLGLSVAGSSIGSRGMLSNVPLGRLAGTQQIQNSASGTATPPSGRIAAQPLMGGGTTNSFAFQRLPSAAYRATSMAQLQNAYRRVPSLAVMGAAPRPHHSRNPSNHSVPLPPPAVSPMGLPPLMTAAPVADDSYTPLLEALPAYGNEVDVPIGGDLTVVFRHVEGLATGLRSNEKLVVIDAVMVIKSSDPIDNTPSSRLMASWIPDTDGSTRGHISLRDYEEVFRDVTASAELHIEFFIYKGTEAPAHLRRQAVTQGSSTGAMTWSTGDGSRASATIGVSGGATQGQGTAPTVGGGRSGVPVELTSIGVFAGLVRVPLLLTLGRERSQEWRLPLERKAGLQLIRGYVTLSFEWSMTDEGMLIREVTALERILAEKVELLALLNPLPVSETSRFVRAPEKRVLGCVPRPPSSGPAAADLSAGLPASSPDAPAATGRSASMKKTAKAMMESYFINLEVSVLEVAGLLPREGLRASIAASMYGKQNASVMSTAMLPRAVVSMTCGGETHSAAAGFHSVSPRFPKNTYTFQNVPLGAKVELKVLDQISRSYTRTLAEAEVQIAEIPGTDPIYAWLALPRRKHTSRSQRMLALLMVLEEEGDADIQVLVRIKIHKPQMHGVLMAVTLDLAGMGLCSKTNLEELFNFTMQKIRASLTQTRTELRTSLAVQAIQLDNQMLEANNPVVLSAADGSQSGSVAHARRRHMARLARRAKMSSSILRLGGRDPSMQDPLLTLQVFYNQASSNQAFSNVGGHQDRAGILSFKKVVVELGPLDFSADQEFIEAAIAYFNALPLADVYQDEAWQHKVDVMQGAGAAHLGAAEESGMYGGRRIEQNPKDKIAWLTNKEAAELELLRGQSSMWFYLEEFYISDIFINVTLALSSNFNSGGGLSVMPVDSKDEERRSMLRGFLSRVSGNQGFQLLNVTNAPIQLDYIKLQNHLVNRVSLVNKLHRHYQWLAVAQARKMLNGAGPAIAAIPASLLWAGLALMDLSQDVAAKRMSPLLVPTRIGYVMFTVMGQVIGVLSRTMCAVMGILPPRFSTDNLALTDVDAARRFGVKPQTVLDALFLAQRDFLLGLMSGAFGIVHDTAAGGRWQGGFVGIGIPMGLVKASLGLAVRPAAGAVEATSKLLQGFGLLCLGKRGIQGKLIRRVQAPGIAITDVVQAARASAAQEALHAGLIAAWQAALPFISSTLADDEVVDVIAARPTRVVLLTNQHLAYLYARRHSEAWRTADASSSSRRNGAFSVTYRVKWIIRNDHIDNIRGLERNYGVSVDYHKPVKLGRMSLKLPLHRGMRTTTAEGHKDLIFRLNRHIGHANGQASTVKYSNVLTVANTGAASRADDVTDLRITRFFTVDGGPAGLVPQLAREPNMREPSLRAPSLQATSMQTGTSNGLRELC